MLLLDPTHADVRAQFAMAEAEYSQRAENAAAAAKFAAIHAALREAREFPESFLGYSRLTGNDAILMAERAAVADLAMRMAMSENTVRAHGYVAQVLCELTPSVWAWFREGEISTANAREVSGIAALLPRELCASFEEAMLEPAKTLAPARFRTMARATRDRLQARQLAERHEQAMQSRTVTFDHDNDGMGWLNIRMSSEKIALAVAQIDAKSFELFTRDGETRSMGQLRADVAAELLVGTDRSAKARVSVALTVPMLSPSWASLTSPPFSRGWGRSTSKQLAVLRRKRQPSHGF